MSDKAILAAEKAQQEVNNCIKQGVSFRLEAGAGAGKTYSLVKALQAIIFDRGARLIKANQRIACITYTEVAKNEIIQEIDSHEAIVVETIHSFCWSFMKHFQSSMRDIINEFEGYKEEIEAQGGIEGKLIEYKRGYFKAYSDKISIKHDDVPLLMAKILKLPKVQRLFFQQYPILFIDEYQDTNVQFMDALNEVFISTKFGPLIGFFGDHWQTIHSTDFELKNYDLHTINKGSNFRSTKKIVDVLNKLRPNLTQSERQQSFMGEVCFYHTNSFKGARRTDSHNKGDLPIESVIALKDTLLEDLKKNGWDLKETKVLMLTHNLIASQQGYGQLAKVFGRYKDSFTKKEDPVVQFLADTIEPMCEAFKMKKYGEMFRILGKWPTITCHMDKLKWKNEINQLNELRETKDIGSVISFLLSSEKLPKSKKVLKLEKELKEGLANIENTPLSNSLVRYQKLLKIPYSELINLVFFLGGGTPLATQHGVKGAEYDNVLVILSGGWNHYNWPRFLDLLKTKKVNEDHHDGFYRSRNLFYVSISRPKQRLAVLTTQALSANAILAAEELFGVDNVVDIEVPVIDS